MNHAQIAIIVLTLFCICLAIIVLVQISLIKANSIFIKELKNAVNMLEFESAKNNIGFQAGQPTKAELQMFGRSIRPIKKDSLFLDFVPKVEITTPDYDNEK